MKQSVMWPLVRLNSGVHIGGACRRVGARDATARPWNTSLQDPSPPAGRLLEAAHMLSRRGLTCDVSSLVRITTATAEASTRLRDAALEAALRLPVPSDGPLAGKRVRVSLDGGRVRTRRTHRGRKTAKGRHGFAAPWREPRVLVIDILDAQGQPDRLRLPL